ncbi:histidine kinase [Calothrix sp. PCC 6303]|uniref:histidine kinase n=1 Tax=Calothrix sp. PCC 6303 TaxID=1170562 RepID=UPI0002A01E76|nr:histidine kinase [Calothrix sp. PCC 6303]AFZ00339.1 histidine kinase [Calothrix sp. PCC 6303]
MDNLSKLNLTPDSNLGNLPLWEVNIEYNYIGKQLIKIFEQNSLIPGVMITRNHHYQGMISRRIFFEFMSRPYSLGLFLERDIESLYNILKPKVLTLTEEVLIVDAIPIILARDSQQIYEPIVIKSTFDTIAGDSEKIAESVMIKSTTDNYRIVDVHQLLLAYSQIQISTLFQLKKLKEESQIVKNNLQSLLQVEEVNTKNGIGGNETQDINNSANLLLGNVIHVNRYVHELLKLISLYQEFYPEPPVEIRQVMNQINVEYISAEMPKMLSLVKNSARQIQQFARVLKDKVLG